MIQASAATTHSNRFQQGVLLLILSVPSLYIFLFLYCKIDEILLRSGFDEMQRRTWQIDRKLKRIAACVLLSGETNFRDAVWTDFVLSPFFTQRSLRIRRLN